MKKITVILFSFLLTFSSVQEACAQRLTVKTTTVDVGGTGYEQPVTATFELRNKGFRRLIIESVKPDCGCTKIEYPKEVGVGDKFTIKILPEDVSGKEQWHQETILPHYDWCG